MEAYHNANPDPHNLFFFGCNPIVFSDFISMSFLKNVGTCPHTETSEKVINVSRDFAQVFVMVQVPPQKRGRFLGPAGLNLRRLTADTGVQESFLQTATCSLMNYSTFL